MEIYPSTAAASHMRGGHGGLMSGGGYPNEISESFDMDFMMPPDIASIDSDIIKLGALTPSPMPNYGY